MENYIGIYDNYSGDAQYNQPVSSIDKFFFSKTIIILLCTEGHAGFNQCPFQRLHSVKKFLSDHRGGNTFLLYGEKR